MQVVYRKVLSDDGRGNVALEIEQEQNWRFVLFKGTFRTRLHVTSNRQKGTVSVSTDWAKSTCMRCRHCTVCSLTHRGERSSSGKDVTAIAFRLRVQGLKPNYIGVLHCQPLGIQTSVGRDTNILCEGFCVLSRVCIWGPIPAA